MASLKPTSQRPPSEGPISLRTFAQLLVFIFLSVLLVRLIALLESLESPDLHLPAGATSGASASALQPLHLRLAIRRTWACREPLFSLLLDTVSDKTEGDGSREAIEGMSMSTELSEATRRRSRTVKTTGNIPGNAPS